MDDKQVIVILREGDDLTIFSTVTEQYLRDTLQLALNRRMRDGNEQITTDTEPSDD